MRMKKKILIIEDDQEIAGAFGEFLACKNYEVLTADDGLEGLKRLEELSGKIDLILTDMVMPYVSGMGVISITKKKYPRIPVLAITGAGALPAAMAAEYHADLVMQKPIDMHQMEKIIENLIWKRKGEAATESEMSVH
ncbi:MAG: response regulator [Deltaproteobacteria bacterium]|nr:response regulator [Deltaproteobacteria bacterium]